MKKFGKDIDKLNNDIEEYNRQKDDYDKEKEKMVEEYKDVIREIFEYKAKKKLLNEISQGFDKVEENLDEMKRKLKKDRKNVENMNQFQVYYKNKIIQITKIIISLFIDSIYFSIKYSQ